LNRDGKNICVCENSWIKSAANSKYLRVVGILIPAYKQVGCEYYTIYTRGYLLRAKKLKLKLNLYFIKLNLIKIKIIFIFC